MARQKFVFVGVILLALSFLAWARFARQADAAPVPAGGLSGKALFIQAKDGVVFHLEKPETRELGGRTFVVGKEATKSEFCKTLFGGSTVWIPLENVTEMVELDGPAK